MPHASSPSSPSGSSRSLQNQDRVPLDEARLAGAGDRDRQHRSSAATDPTSPAEGEEEDNGSAQPAPAAAAAAAAAPPENDTHIDQACTWPLKRIAWPPFVDYPRDVQILCQAENGPCSLIALINILSLRGDIHIPLHLRTATFSFLSTLVADCLLRRSTAAGHATADLDFALSILPKTLNGLDVNVDFISGAFSRPEGTQPGELELFQLAGIPMRHGWLCSPDERETYDVLVGTASSYDEAVMRCVQGDELTGGAITASGAHGTDTIQLEQIFEDLSEDPEKQARVYQAQVIRRWLDASTTQLTYAGLFELSEKLEPGSLCALFRNAHFSALYRRPDTPVGPGEQDAAIDQESSSSQYMPRATLFHLVTDASLLHEPQHVWESLEDVEGANSQFFDSALRPAQSRHDYARQQQSAAQRNSGRERGEDADMALAAQMQQDEYDREEMYARREQREREQEKERDRERQRLEPEQREQRGTQAGPIAQDRNTTLPASGHPVGSNAHEQHEPVVPTTTPGRTGVTRAKNTTDKAKGKGKDKKDKGCIVS